MVDIQSSRRDMSVEENLANFKLMTEGTEAGVKFCLRAKISFTDPNEAMRDPVIFHCNPKPHHRSESVFLPHP